MDTDVISTQMANLPVGGVSATDLISHAGPIGLVVLGLLVVFSVVSWGIIWVKWLALRQAWRESLEFLDIFWQSRRLDEIFQRAETMNHSPLAQVFRQGYQELVKVKQREKNQKDGLPVVHLSGAENVERALRRAASAEMTELEKLVPFLATVGSTSPFIGLFGTVVGIMKSFQSIGMKGSANLATVAPGIAEALVATAAGLLAAIPAVIAYNTFSQRIKVVGAEMDNFSSDFMNIIRRHFF